MARNIGVLQTHGERASSTFMNSAYLHWKFGVLLMELETQPSSSQLLAPIQTASKVYRIR